MGAAYSLMLRWKLPGRSRSLSVLNSRLRAIGGLFRSGCTTFCWWRPGGGGLRGSGKEVVYEDIGAGYLPGWALAEKGKWIVIR